MTEHLTPVDNAKESEARRAFLVRCGGFAVVTPPLITALLNVFSLPNEANASTGALAALSSFITPALPLPRFGRHPRTLTATMVARVAARWNDPAYAPLVARYKTGGVAALSGIGVGLQYLATGSTTNLNAAVTAALALSYSVYNPVANHGDFYLADDAAILLDWCYNALTSAQRAALVAQLENFTAQREAGIPTAFRLHESQYMGLHAYIFGCLAAQGEPGFTDRSDKLRNVVQNYLALQTEASGDGTWTDYSYQGSYWASIPILYSIATGQDVRPLAPWLANRPAGYIRGMHPDLGWQVSHRGDQSQSEIAGAPNYTAVQRSCCAEMYMLADFMRDPTAQWAGDKLRAKFGWEGQDAQGWAWQSLVFYDDTLTGVAPTNLATGWSAATNFPQLGYTHMRDAFTLNGSDTDTRCWVYGGNIRDHDHSAAGHILILRGYDDLITSGFTYTTAVGVYQQTWGGNSMGWSTLMLTPAANAATPDASGRQRQPLIAATKAASSAAFPASDALHYQGGTPYTVSSLVTSFTTDGVVDKVVLDNSMAYVPTTQATNVLRTVWYVRGAGSGVADTFIIWDRWTPAAGGLYKPRQIWWGKVKPMGGAETVVTGSSSAGVITVGTGNISISRGTSKVVIQPLSTLVSRQFIGGVGFENWQDGAQVPFQTQAEAQISLAQYNARVRRCLGQWRTELTIANAGTEIIIAISVGASGVSAPALSVTAGSPRTIAVGTVTISLN